MCLGGLTLPVEVVRLLGATGAPKNAPGRIAVRRWVRWCLGLGAPGMEKCTSSRGGSQGFLNTARVRHGWSDLLCRVEWDLFVTLTFDPKRFPRSGPEGWLSSVRWFLAAWLQASAVAAGLAYTDGRRLRGPWANAWRHGRGRPMWCLAIEPHADGRLHAHVLVKLAGQLKRLDWAIGSRLWNDSRGLCRFEVPRSQEHVTRYVAKYVVKFGSDAVTLSENFDAARMPAGGAGGVAS